MPSFTNILSYLNENFCILLIGAFVIAGVLWELYYRSEVHSDTCPICGRYDSLSYYKGKKICSSCTNTIEKVGKHKKDLLESLIKERKYRSLIGEIGSEDWKKQLSMCGVHTKKEKEVFMKAFQEINNVEIN